MRRFISAFLFLILLGSVQITHGASVLSEETTKSEFVQLEHLKIDTISSPTLPAVISLSSDDQTACKRYESETSVSPLRFICPSGPTHLYEVTVTDQTTFLAYNRTAISFSTLASGQFVNVYGIKDATTGAVRALIVRVLSKPSFTQIQVNNARVVSVSDTSVTVAKDQTACIDYERVSAGMATTCPPSTETTYTIALNAGTRILDRTRFPLSVASILPGDQVNAYGVFANGTLTAQILRDLSVPRTTGSGSSSTIPSIPTPPSPTSSVPGSRDVVLFSLSPTNSYPEKTVTLIGKGFAQSLKEGGNTVFVGKQSIPSLVSLDGTTLSFPTPRMTASGTYPVSVITPRGSSNELSLFITIPSLSTNELSVKDYGAKGDGVTDDAPAIQAVFDRVKESGGTVYFPAGTYLLKSIAAPALAVPGVTTPIERSAVMVRGEKITLRGDGASSLLKTGPDLKAHAIEFYFAKDITVKDLAFDGNKVPRDRGVPYPNGLVVSNVVSVVHGSRISFSRVNVMNGLEDGIGFWKSEDGSVTDSYIHDNGTDLTRAAGVSYSASKRGTIARNTIVRNTAVNIWAAFGTDTVTIEDNIVQGSLQDGILIGSEAPGLPFFMPNTNMTVRRNTVSGNGWQGIDVIGVDGATIDQNTVLDNKGVGINLVDQDARYRVAHVSVTQNRSSNTTGRTQQDGIYVRDGADIVVRGNTTEDNGTWIGNQIVVDSDVSVNPDWETANTRTYTPPRTASSTPVALPPTTSLSPAPTSTTDRQGRLALVSLTPSFAAVGETVTLTGTGFTSTGNTILFGSGVIPRVESKNGTTLSFVIPQTLDPECAFATPSCKVASQQTLPGTYAISVKNERGTSASLTLTVVNPEKLSREQLGAMLETARAALQALLGR